jgi:hypothetical protein
MVFLWRPDQKDDTFHTVAMWQGTVVTDANVDLANEDNVVSFFLDFFGTRIKPIGCVLTLPDDSGPGGRCDFAFLIHDDDVMSFAVRRFSLGDETPRWLDDVLDNSPALYPLDFCAEYASS